MYTGKFRIPTNRFCFKCHHRVFHSDVKDYPYVCPHCDENKYRFETYELHGNIMLHKPHSQKELKKYQIKQLKEFLEQEDLI